RAGGIDMSAKELREVAAKAAGYSLIKGSRGCREFLCKRGAYWTPLEDDGDALRLASKLLVDIGQFPSEVVAAVDIDEHPASFRLLFIEPVNNEEYRGESTRRAIVRAAARIGRRYED